MKPQELQNLIKELDKPNPNEEAYLGIFLNDRNEDQAYLKANKKGLELVAALFLKASSEVNTAKVKNEGVYLELNSSKSWFDKESELSIDFVEIVGSKPESKPEYVPKWYDSLSGYGCITIVVLILIAAIIGFVTIGKWMVN